MKLTYINIRLPSSIQLQPDNHTILSMIFATPKSNIVLPFHRSTESLYGTKTHFHTNKFYALTMNNFDHKAPIIIAPIIINSSHHSFDVHA